PTRRPQPKTQLATRSGLRSSRPTLRRTPPVPRKPRRTRLGARGRRRTTSRRQLSLLLGRFYYGWLPTAFTVRCPVFLPRLVANSLLSHRYQLYYLKYACKYCTRIPI